MCQPLWSLQLSRRQSPLNNYSEVIKRPERWGEGGKLANLARPQGCFPRKRNCKPEKISQACLQSPQALQAPYRMPSSLHTKVSVTMGKLASKDCPNKDLQECTEHVQSCRLKGRGTEGSEDSQVQCTLWKRTFVALHCDGFGYVWDMSMCHTSRSGVSAEHPPCGSRDCRVGKEADCVTNPVHSSPACVCAHTCVHACGCVCVRHLCRVL